MKRKIVEHRGPWYVSHSRAFPRNFGLFPALFLPSFWTKFNRHSRPWSWHLEKKKDQNRHSDSGPVLRDTARLSQRYPPIARYGVFGVPTWPIGCDTPSAFSEHFPLWEHAKWRCDTPPSKGVSQRYLRDTLWKQGRWVRYPPLRYYLERVLRDMGGGLSRTGPPKPALKRPNRHLVEGRGGLCPIYLYCGPISAQHPSCQGRGNSGQCPYCRGSLWVTHCSALLPAPLCHVLSSRWTFRIFLFFSARGGEGGVRGAGGGGVRFLNANPRRGRGEGLGGCPRRIGELGGRGGAKYFFRGRNDIVHQVSSRP